MNKTIKMDAMDLMEILVIICDMIDLCGLSQPAILSIRRIKQILVRTLKIVFIFKNIYYNKNLFFSNRINIFWIESRKSRPKSAIT